MNMKTRSQKSGLLCVLFISVAGSCRAVAIQRNSNATQCRFAWILPYIHFSTVGFNSRDSWLNWSIWIHILLCRGIYDVGKWTFFILLLCICFWTKLLYFMAPDCEAAAFVFFHYRFIFFCYELSCKIFLFRRSTNDNLIIISYLSGFVSSKLCCYEIFWNTR